MEEELELYEIWQIVVKRWKMIVLIPLTAALVTFFYSSFLITPLYRASTTLMVTLPIDAGQIIYHDLLATRQLVGTYREIVRSNRVLESVVVDSDLPYGVNQLRDKVEVEAIRDTELITVNVTDPDPLVASEIANELASTFIVEIVDIMNVENVRVVDEAAVPGRPVSPRVGMNVAVAFLVGLMGAVGLAFLLNYLDQSIKDPAEAQSLLNLPVIGVVPIVEGSSLFAASDPRSPPAEAFRTLRTNIQYSSVDKPIKHILVTGANPQCGKSTVAANLAVTMARSGKTVLLIDADMRRPTQHDIFDINSEPGLSSLIFKEVLTLDEVMHKSAHNNLRVLPSGPIPPYPAEMLASDRMKRLTKHFAEKFDYLIYDSPPVIAVTDAALLSNLTDGTLIVLDYGRVTRDEAVEALEQLHKVQANVIGTVINGMRYSKAYYSGYNYYGISRSERHKQRRGPGKLLRPKKKKRAEEPEQKEQAEDSLF